MNTNEKIDKLQKLDPLSEAEKLTGASYKENKLTESIGFLFHMEKNKAMNALMDETGDTKFNDTEEDYLKKVLAFGFESILVEPFISSKGIEERLHCLWHKEKSILLVFDTFTWGDDGSWAKAGKTVPLPGVNGISDSNGCTSSGGCVTAYADENFIERKNPVERPKWDGKDYEKFSKKLDKWELKDKEYRTKNNLKYVWGGYHICREAVKHNINKMDENGVFVKKWMKMPFLWIINYMDTKNDNYDYKSLNNQRIAKFPQYVKDAICFE